MEGKFNLYDAINILEEAGLSDEKKNHVYRKLLKYSRGNEGSLYSTLQTYKSESHLPQSETSTLN